MKAPKHLKRKDWKVIPIGDLVDHDEDGRVCWCQPEYLRICKDCAGSGCWKCDDSGYVETTVTYKGPVIVLHDAADGRD